ncbi:hypothetical protein Leryth_006951 [Lithospermum erythrorhizon]|nr:hypothetical protein Leryth_006951 [Lithospermum erythrorhizon]
MEPDFSEAKMRPRQMNVVPVPFPSSAATVAETSNTAAEETNSLKKPRLGWGEGLAKYEKIKVESSDEPGKNVATTCGSNLEPLHPCLSNLTGKSPNCEMVSKCASPATPSLVACSSSPGLEGQKLVEAGSTDHDHACICNSSSVTQNESDRSFNLEEFDLASITHLNSSIEELLQSDDPAVQSSFVRSTALNKLFLLKNNISKGVETTETEIELLENELKIISELESSDSQLRASSSLPVACLSKPYEDLSAPLNVVLRPAGLHVVVDSDVAPTDDHLMVTDADVDSLGSATSKSIEASLSKDVSPLEMLREIEVTEDPDLNFANTEMEPEMAHLVKEKSIDLYSEGITSQLVGCSSVSSDDSLDFCSEEFSQELKLAFKGDFEQIASGHKLLPSNGCNFDFSSVVKASCVQNDSVKERFFRKKYYYKLREKILNLKYKIFWHLWYEDMHTLSLKKLCGITHKRYFGLRKVNSNYQKHCPSVRSRCSSTAGLSLVATTELLSYARRLLAEPPIAPLRRTLKMPPMIINKQERMEAVFISYNGVVEDPLAVEKETSIFNPWSPEEEELFIDKLAEFGKDFKRISSFLDHKTIADCIQFYYKSHKSDAFKRAKKKPEFSKQSATTYMLTSGNRCNREANVVSLEILSAVSAIAAKIDNCAEIQQKHTSKSFLVSGSYKMKSGGDKLVHRSNNRNLYNNEREAVPTDVLAGISGSLLFEDMSSSITGSLDPGEGCQDQKYQRMGSSTRQPLTPEVTQNVVETCSDKGCGEIDPTYWTDEEKTLFIQAVSSYGKDFTMVSRCVRTKTQVQCKVFFSKARKCLGLDKICLGTENLMTDDNGSSRDAYFLETGTAMCNGKPGLRIGDDFAFSNLKLGHNPMKVSIVSGKPVLNSSQEIVVGDMNSTFGLTSRNLLPVDQAIVDNFELALDGNEGSRNSTVVVSNLDVADGVRQSNDENLPNLVETEDSVLVFDGSHGSSTEVVPDFYVADDVEQANPTTLPMVSETKSRSRHLNAACIGVPEAKPDGEGCLCESSLTANLKTEETCTKCSLHDEHFGVHLSGTDSVQQTLESGVVEKHLLMQQPGSALPDTPKHRKHLYDDASVEQHPLAVSTIKDITSDVSCKRLIPDGANVARYLGQDFHVRRCNSRKADSSVAELASVPHEGDPSGSHHYINKLSTNGDVKLFGQVLSKTSHQKPNARACLSEGCTNQHDSSGSKSCNSMKCSSSQQAVNVLSPHIKYDHNNNVDLDNLPPRNIVFQDQNRIPNGSSTLPDSTFLLARYPTSFSNYAPPPSKMELSSLNTAKYGECSLNGVATFSNKDVSVSNGSADLHVYQNQVQSFSLGMRQRHDHLLAQMQKINGFDVVPTLQQPSAGMVAINVVGGTVLGTQIVGVSDPVAAIRMHYAKSEQQQFSGGHLATNIIREGDPWRGKGSLDFYLLLQLLGVCCMMREFKNNMSKANEWEYFVLMYYICW